MFEPEIRLPENYRGARTPVTPATHNQNPPTRSRIQEPTQMFLQDYTSFTPAPTLYGPPTLGKTFTVWAQARLSNTLNLTTRKRQSALNVLATPSLELFSNQQKNIILF